MFEKNKKKFSDDKEDDEFFYYYGGDNASIGFCMIPRVIFEKQRYLGLTDGELNVFLHFLHGLSKGREEKPHCYKTAQSPKYLSIKTGKSQRQIARAVSGLNEKGFIKPEKEYRAVKGAMIRSHNIKPGIDKIMELAKQHREEKNEKDTSLKLKKNKKEQPVVIKDKG